MLLVTLLQLLYLYIQQKNTNGLHFVTDLVSSKPNRELAQNRDISEF